MALNKKLKTAMLKHEKGESKGFEKKEEAKAVKGKKPAVVIAIGFKKKK